MGILRFCDFSLFDHISMFEIMNFFFFVVSHFRVSIPHLFIVDDNGVDFFWFSSRLQWDEFGLSAIRF